MSSCHLFHLVGQHQDNIIADGGDDAVAFSAGERFRVRILSCEQIDAVRQICAGEQKKPSCANVHQPWIGETKRFGKLPCRQKSFGAIDLLDGENKQQHEAEEHVEGTDKTLHNRLVLLGEHVQFDMAAFALRVRQRQCRDERPQKA